MPDRVVTANNYECLLHETNEVVIRTTPTQLEATQGRVYLTTVELRELLHLSYGLTPVKAGVGPVPRLGDHLEQTFLVQVEIAVELTGQIGDEAHFREVLAANFLDHPALENKELAKDLVVVWRSEVRKTGLPPAPCDLVHKFVFKRASEAMAFYKGYYLYHLNAEDGGVEWHDDKPYREYEPGKGVVVTIYGELPGYDGMEPNEHAEVWHFEGLDA